jgi:hypothetical protein
MSTTVDVTWTRPTVIGRDDYFYVVEVSDPDRVNAFNVHNSNLVNETIQPTYKVSPLVPHTSYVIRVSVHNGVSDQDPDGHLRICEVEVMTLEGGKKKRQAVVQCIEGGVCTAFTIIQLMVRG